MTTATTELDNHDGIPYVGPRAFRTGEVLYARDRETHELADLLVAERIVLLHAPSGAGKTSVIRAGLRPLLEQRNFRPTVPLRVNTPPPPNGDVHNRYVYSTALGLLGERRQPSELAGLELGEVVEEAEAGHDNGFLVLVFDQFEEILTIDPTDWESQAGFFMELGAVLANGPVWALFSMREDYMGGLERYVRFLPGHLRATYRLDFLDRTAAKAAIQRPAREHGIEFTDEAAAELVRRLSLVKVQRPDSDVSEIEAPFVQPVQLQVVCRRLWKSVAQKKADDFSAIDLADVEAYADIPKALRSYYGSTVEEVAAQTGMPEVTIRDWFEKELITAQRFRCQTVTGPEAPDVDSKGVLEALEAAYLIRSDERANVLWWELTHDLLIDAIVDDNLTWKRRRLQPWQLAARAWEVDRAAGRLLDGAELREVTKHVSASDMNKLESEFVAASERAEHEQGRLRRWQGAASFVGALAIAEAIVIVILVVLLLADQAGY